MGTMTVGLVIAGIVVVGVGMFAMRWRSASSEQQALRHYQNALDTLRTVSDRMESSRPVVEPKSQLASEEREEAAAKAPNGTAAWEDKSERQESRISSSTLRTPAESRQGASGAGRAASGRAASGGAGSGRGASRSSRAPVRETPLRQTPRHKVPPSEEPTPADGMARVERNPLPGHDGGAHPVLVFDEDVPAGEPAAASGGGTFSAPPVTRASRLALQRSSRPASRVPVVLGVVVVVVAVAVLVVLAAGLGSHHHTTSPTTVVHHHVTTPPTHDQATTATSGTTSTTAVQTVQPLASTATPRGATYQAPSGQYTVLLTSSGDCWVYAKLVSTGALLWTGDLLQGQSQAVTGTGEIEVQLGHANTMTETLNGVHVEYPAQYQAVFTMMFVPTTT